MHLISTSAADRLWRRSQRALQPAVVTRGTMVGLSGWHAMAGQLSCCLGDRVTSTSFSRRGARTPSGGDAPGPGPSGCAERQDNWLEQIPFASEHVNG